MVLVSSPEGGTWGGNSEVAKGVQRFALRSGEHLRAIEDYIEIPNRSGHLFYAIRRTIDKSRH